jgi:hypothetical protein
VAQIIEPGDSEETRLRKIYAKVQQLRRVPAGSRWTEEEIREEKDHPIKHARDVWEQRRGVQRDLNRLFLGLVRAAGVQADLVLAPRRDEQLFHQKLLDPEGLVDQIILVKIDGKDVFLDPGTRYLPFGMLGWENTAQDGLLISSAEARWVPLLKAVPADARIERRAALQYNSEHVLQGTVEVTYSGQEALWRRGREHGEDAAARRTFLEKDLAAAIPVACSVKLLNEPDWDGPDTPLVAKLSLTIPDWTQTAGSRTLFPVGIFSSGERKRFIGTQRTQVIYFRVPYILHDDVQVQLPSGWRVQSLPKAADIDKKVLRYQSRAEDQAGSLHLTRDLTIGALLIGPGQYDVVKAFYDSMRAADEDRAVVGAGQPAGN